MNGCAGRCFLQYVQRTLKNTTTAAAKRETSKVSGAVCTHSHIVMAADMVTLLVCGSPESISLCQELKFWVHSVLSDVRDLRRPRSKPMELHYVCEGACEIV